MSLASSLVRDAPEEELEAPLDAGSAVPDLLAVSVVSDFELASGFADLLFSGAGAAVGAGLLSGGGAGLGGGFNSGFFRIRSFVNISSPAMAFAVSQIHALQHFGPVSCVNATSSRAN